MFYEQDIGPELLGRENSESIIQQYRGNTPLSYPALILLFSPAKKPAHSVPVHHDSGMHTADQLLKYF